jgi:hypothetical protein
MKITLALVDLIRRARWFIVGQRRLPPEPLQFQLIRLMGHPTPLRLVS